jgi:hypothetical protein
MMRGLAALALAWTQSIGSSREARAAGSDQTTPPRDPEARRRWALTRMDEMARERLRCHERFKEPRDIRACQAEFERRHRAYNEVYMEAARQ